MDFKAHAPIQADSERPAVRPGTAAVAARAAAAAKAAAQQRSANAAKAAPPTAAVPAKETEAKGPIKAGGSGRGLAQDLATARARVLGSGSPGLGKASGSDRSDMTVKAAAQPGAVQRPSQVRTPKTAPPQLSDEAISAQDSPNYGVSAPEVFSMAAGDDDDNILAGSPSQWNTIPLEGLDDDEVDEPEDPSALSIDEQQQYEEIQASFERFKSRQSEVEKNVADLLMRLNTRMHIPSSVASSECGDNFSMASSEWDTESLGPTEDGLSLLGSRVGSRAGTPPNLSPLASPRDGLSSLHRLSASSSSGKLPGLSTEKGAELLRQLKVNDSTPSQSFRKSDSYDGDGGQRSERGAGTIRGTGHGGAERGDLRGSPQRRSPSPAVAANTTATPSQGTEDATPRLTQQLLAVKAGQEGPAASAAGPAPPRSAPDAAPNQAWSSPQSLSTRNPAQGNIFASSTPTNDAAVLPAKQAGAQPLPQFGAPEALSPAQGTGSDDEELKRWQGWTVVATAEGRLFFHNELRQLSQWVQPPELCDILGDWEEIIDESQPSQPSFWRNEQLRISLWKDPRQTSNIFQAALDGNLFFMQLYAEVDGQLEVVDPKGRSALHYSCAGGATQSALFLLQRQAEVDRRDDGAATPLIFACRYGYASVVKVLLDARADLHAACEGGNTALHEASAMGQLDCLHLLLLCGADAGSRNKDGEVSADIAAARRHYSCLTLLRRHSQPAHRPDGVARARGGAAGAGMRSAVPALQASVSTTEATPKPASAIEVAHGDGQAGAARAKQPTGTSQRHRAPQVEYDGGSDSGDSESDLGEVFGRAGDIGATSDSSDGGEGRGADPGSQLRNKRSSRSRQRERSPVALGLLGRMRTAVGSASRWAFPVQADLGLPLAYSFNEETKEWELCGSDGAEVQ